MSSPDDSALIQIENSTIKCSKVKKKLLGVQFDILEEPICKKAHRKLSALSRKVNYMELPKRRILMNAFFKAQFNYCPIIWMFHSRCLNNKINRLREKCLRMMAIFKTRIWWMWTRIRRMRRTWRTRRIWRIRRTRQIWRIQRIWQICILIRI